MKRSRSTGSDGRGRKPRTPAHSRSPPKHHANAEEQNKQGRPLPVRPVAIGTSSVPATPKPPTVNPQTKLTTPVGHKPKSTFLRADGPATPVGHTQKTMEPESKPESKNLDPKIPELKIDHAQGHPVNPSPTPVPPRPTITGSSATLGPEPPPSLRSPRAALFGAEVEGVSFFKSGPPGRLHKAAKPLQELKYQHPKIPQLQIEYNVPEEKHKHKDKTRKSSEHPAQTQMQKDVTPEPELEFKPESPKIPEPKKEVVEKRREEKPKARPEPHPEVPISVIKPPPEAATTSASPQELKPSPTPAKSEPDKIAQIVLKATQNFQQLMKARKKGEKLPEMELKYGIPDQKHLLDKLLDKEPKIFDFGGFLRQYFSPSLRTFTLFNQQGRYRGTENVTCLTSIDIDKMASKDDAEASTRARNLKKLDHNLEDLRAAAVDDEHFEFLKGFAKMQAITFPITVTHGMLQETVPMLDEIFHFYVDNLGQDHKCTIEAGEHFVRHRNRLNMYDNL